MEFPGRYVEVACDRCERYGRYSKWKLMKAFGPAANAEQLLWLLAQRQCRQKDRRLRCVAHFTW